MTARRLIISALLGTIAAVAVAGPAQAVGVHPTSVVCAVEGAAMAAPFWRGGAPGPYAFAPAGLGINCVYSTTDGPGAKMLAPAVGIASVTVASAGAYDSQVCGTGTAADDGPVVTAVVTTPPNPAFDAMVLGADLGYNIVFVAGQGVLTWDADSDEPGGGDITSSPNVVPAKGPPAIPVGGGYVNIVPFLPLGPFAIDGAPCTAGFAVAGVVSGNVAV